MKTSNVITAIDIGSSKVCCCIATVLANGEFNIIGVGYCVCYGVKSGVIIDMASVEKSIAKAVENAEKMANVRVKSVYISISGKNVESKIVNISLNIGGQIVKNEDIQRLFSCCNEKDETREIIHLIPILYSVDSLNGIKDPIGMVANQLSVNVNLVTVPKAQLHNILVCFAKCHLEVVGIVTAGYASGLYVMDEGDTSGNQIVVDFGGGTTTVSFFYDGIFCGSEVVLIGGKNITSDIAYGLNISVANAERLKTLHGAAFLSVTDDRDMIFAPVIEDDDIINLQRIPKSSLNQIIQARVEEILTAVKKKINESVFSDSFSRSIIITGGGSMLTGLRDFTGGLLNKKIKTRKMDDFIDGSDVQINNDFATVLGTIRFAQLSSDGVIKTRRSDGKDEKISFFKKTLMWIENNL